MKNPEEPISPGSETWHTCKRQVDAFTGNVTQREENVIASGELDEGNHEAQKSKGITLPKKPSQEEQEEHNRTHCPFRAWCTHCIKGKAISDPHRLTGESPDGIPIVHIDYMYLIENREERGQPILAGIDGKTRIMFAHVVPEKGASIEWVSQPLIRDLEKFGHHGKLAMKGGRELALRGRC